MTEYDIQFVWLPDDADPTTYFTADMTRGWTPTPESLAKARRPSELLRLEERDGIPGRIVRLEVKREVN